MCIDLDEGTVRTQKIGTKFLAKGYYNTPYRSLEINYFAGYSELPADLKLVVLDIVSYIEAGEEKPTQNLMAASIDNPAPYVANSFPPHIRRVLDLYRYSPGDGIK